MEELKRVWLFRTRERTELSIGIIMITCVIVIGHVPEQTRLFSHRGIFELCKIILGWTQVLREALIQKFNYIQGIFNTSQSPPSLPQLWKELHFSSTFFLLLNQVDPWNHETHTQTQGHSGVGYPQLKIATDFNLLLLTSLIYLFEIQSLLH